MKRVLLLWYTENENFGDVLIYETVKSILEKNGMQTGYMDVGMPCHEVFAKANEYDFLLFAGGGIIERYIPNVIRYFKEDFDELKVPYGVIGLSIGKFDYSEHRESLGFWIDNADFFYARDAYTASCLNHLCNTDRVLEGVDVVWANNRIYSTDTSEKKLRGINVRDVPYTDIQNDMDWGKLREIVKRLGCDCTIVDESGKNAEVQLIQGEEVAKYSVETALQQIWNCKHIIAMRYHVVLVAAANGIPVIPITYCPKVQELAKQIGIERYTVDVDGIAVLEEKVQALQDWEKSYVKTNCVKMRKRAEAILCTISNIIKETKEIKR